MMAMAHNGDGYLVNGGMPYDHATIADQCRVDVECIEENITVLLELGRLGVTEEGVYYVPRMVKDAEALAKQQAYGSRGGNPRILKGGVKASETEEDGFAEFWKEYPRKVAKQKAWETYLKKQCIDHQHDIMAALEVQKQSRQWTKDGGQFIPHPATWLNQGRWNDEDVFIPGDVPDNRRHPQTGAVLPDGKTRKDFGYE